MSTRRVQHTLFLVHARAVGVVLCLVWPLGFFDFLFFFCLFAWVRRREGMRTASFEGVLAAWCRSGRRARATRGVEEGRKKENTEGEVGEVEAGSARAARPEVGWPFFFLFSVFCADVCVCEGERASLSAPCSGPLRFAATCAHEEHSSHGALYRREAGEGEKAETVH